MKVVTATKNKRYRTHTGGNGDPCIMSSDEIPPVELEAGPVGQDADPSMPEEGRDWAKCPACERRVGLTRLGYYQHHEETLRGGVRCAASGSRHRGEEVVPVADPDLLGDPKLKTHAKVRDSQIAPISGTAEEVYKREEKSSAPKELMPAPLEEPGKGNLERQPMPAPDADPSVTTETDSPESPTTSKDSNEPSAQSMTEIVVFSLGIQYSESFRQPLSPFLQPPDYVKAEKIEMSEKGKEIAVRLKEIFYAFSNRSSSDNRGAQTTLGPSEIGTPCDRRLAMSLMGAPPVNPGGDGWAAFVGTCTHDGLEKMFRWASAQSGRFATEMRVKFPSEFVPHGTADLLDRVHLCLIDHKIMGEYSLKKLREQGPPDHYRVQAHTYALGAVLAGEKVKDVAIVAWPRAGSSLDQMYVWTEPFDRKLAEEAIARVDRIARDAFSKGQGPYSKLEVAKTFPVADKGECRYCPFSLPKDAGMERGCPGP